MKLVRVEVRTYWSLFVEEWDRANARGSARRMNVLVGPNNCGKSNVLRAIALALDPAHPYDPATDLPGTMPLPISS